MDLLRLVGDFWWLAPLAGAGLLAYKFLGWRGLLAVVTLGALKGAHTVGKRDERDHLEREAEEDRLRSIKERNAVDAQVRKDGPDAARDYLRGRVNGLHDDPPR